MNIYRKSDGGKWTFRNSIDGESLSRRVEVDNSGQIWCQHIHGGLRKITLDDSMTRIEEMVEFNELGGVKDRLFHCSRSMVQSVHITERSSSSMSRCRKSSSLQSS